MKVIIWLKKFKIKLIMWIKGYGFKMPDPDPKVYCMYNYYKSILNGENKIIEAYENEIKELTDKCHYVTRQDVARLYMAAFEEAYGKEKFECIVDM